MKTPKRMLLLAAALGILVAGCDGSTNSNPDLVPEDPAGFLSLSITDGPWHDASSMMLHITHVELGHSNGQVMRLDFQGGPIDVDIMQLQNGASLQIMDGVTHQFMLEYDIRLGLHHQHMGGMGDRFELHQAMRCMDMANVGGLTGTIDPALIDINHPDCDPAPGGNWAYLFPGYAADPDDIADTETDGVPGPIATDRVDLNVATGDYFYHFGHLTEGAYRVGFTCSGEWDESGDDDYPSNPDGMFDFQMFSDPVDMTAGQMQHLDL